MNRYLPFLMVCLGALLWTSEGLALPDQFVQEGLLTDAQNRPLNGQKSMRVRLYGSPMGNDVLFEETHPAVAVINGYYALLIGGEAPLPDGVFERDTLFFGLAVDGARELSPRTAILPVPAAIGLKQR